MNWNCTALCMIRLAGFLFLGDCGLVIFRIYLNHTVGQLKLESAKDRGQKAVIIIPLNIEYTKQ